MTTRPIGHQQSGGASTTGGAFRARMMKPCAQPANLECGDLSPLLPLWRLVAKADPRSEAGRVGRLSAIDGDKSPAESADKSAHSKEVAASPRCVACSRVP